MRKESWALRQRIGGALKWLRENRISPAASQHLLGELGTTVVRSIESGQCELSLDSLVDKILPAYQRAVRETMARADTITLRDLLALSDALAHEHHSVVLMGPKSAERYGQATRLDAPKVRYCSYLLERLVGHSEVAISRVILDPGARAGGPLLHAHLGQEVLLVIRGGPIAMMIEGPRGGEIEEITVHANQCLVFFAHRRHWAENRGSRQAHCFVVRSPAHVPFPSDLESYTQRPN
jgi:mannose-6-phosphate isomerase-like protein (cupin superfamily)